MNTIFLGTGICPAHKLRRAIIRQLNWRMDYTKVAIKKRIAADKSFRGHRQCFTNNDYFAQALPTAPPNRSNTMDNQSQESRLDAQIAPGVRIAQVYTRPAFVLMHHVIFMDKHILHMHTYNTCVQIGKKTSEHW